MCVSKGAPRKPSYGPCNEQHNLGDMIAMMVLMATLAPVHKETGGRKWN